VFFHQFINERAVTNLRRIYITCLIGGQEITLINDTITFGSEKWPVTARDDSLGLRVLFAALLQRTTFQRVSSMSKKTKNCLLWSIAYSTDPDFQFQTDEQPDAHQLPQPSKRSKYGSTGLVAVNSNGHQPLWEPRPT
jgi:hypothetical protein